MIAVIQCAEGRQPHAGQLTARNGKRVLFVADPEQAPDEPGVWHARPDDVSSFGASWRKLVLGYDANPRNNPLGLLPAHALYPDGIYSELVGELGPKRTYILSAGWGLIRASFLTPNYDITFRADAEAFRRRQPSDRYADFCMLPMDGDEDLYLFAGPDYLPLFCRLTAAYPGRRIVYYHSDKPPKAPGCELRKFKGGDEANWHHACARAFLAARPKPREEKTAPRVSNIEARLRALRKFPTPSASLLAGNAEPDARAVLAAVHGAGHEIAEYLWLMRTYHEVDVTKHSEFQDRFNVFHRVWQRSKEWYTAYYRLLETARENGAQFGKVLDVLWEETGRYEPAHASRLVATVDPSQPIWDRFVLLNTGLRAPSYMDPGKLERAALIYRQIAGWYASRLESPGGRRIVELFDEEVPDHDEFTALKKLEFVLQHLRAGARTPAAMSRAQGDPNSLRKT